MTRVHSPFILAISASPRGFAFVLFEGPTTPFDWGVKDIRGEKKSAESVAAIEKLISEYHPSALILEEASKAESRRGPRIRALLDMTASLAEEEDIPVFRYTRSDVQETFADQEARTRPEIAEAIAARIPAFMTRLPPVRKLWMSEDPRQSLFDAAALGLTFFARALRKK